MIFTRGRWWFAGSFVVAFVLSLALSFATYDATTPRVNVRWSADVTPLRRLELQAAYGLSKSKFETGTTWSYSLLDTSIDNIRRLVEDPATEDTHHIDRRTFRITEPPPAPLLRLSVVSSAVGVVAASFVAAVVALRHRIGQWWRAFLNARRRSNKEAPLSLMDWAARVFVFLVGASYFYMLMEWLFFATKPSFMSRLTTSEVLSIPVTTPLALVIAGVPFGVAAISLLAAVHRVRPMTPLLEWTLFLAPAFIAAAAALLLVDTFSYTLFGHNLGQVQGVGRYAYAALFSGTLIALAWSFERRSRSLFWRRHPRGPLVTCGVLISLSLMITVGNAWSRQPTPELSDQPRPSNVANVLILSTDGLNADHMSVYGYERDTTPFMRALLPELLVAENHFSNSESTAGSIAALLTGKLPTATRVFHSPDVFIGDDVFQHLPGLLREWGYSNVDIGLRFFGDAHDMNMRRAFHAGTGRRLGGWGPLESLRPRLTSELYFLDQLQDRLGSRLRHAFGVEDFVDPLAWQNWNEQTMTDDESRIAELRQFIVESPRPFFAHLHLLGTHGEHFFPTVRLFSADSEQPGPWMTDFYDDSILQFDYYVAAVVQILKALGDYEDTLIVINSDHGSRWTIDRRLPLLIRFPDQEYRGRVTANTQRIDIAPTIVDYLTEEVPAWMTGQSLIGPEPDWHRPIFSFVSAESGRESAGPPFYNLRAVQVVLGDQLYRLDLETTEMHTKRLDDHNAPLEEREFQSIDTVRAAIVQHLRQAGYDVTSLQVP
jgi:arylsulfatase A-like enzyme